jgi:hypothetical protein
MAHILVHVPTDPSTRPARLSGSWSAMLRSMKGGRARLADIVHYERW